MHVQLNGLRGRMVMDATGTVLGRIKMPLVDMETWLVDRLRVRLSGRVAREMGLVWAWWSRPTVDIQTGLIQAAGDAILLRVSLAELREAAPSALDASAEVALH